MMVWSWAHRIWRHVMGLAAAATFLAALIHEAEALSHPGGVVNTSAVAAAFAAAGYLLMSGRTADVSRRVDVAAASAILGTEAAILVQALLDVGTRSAVPRAASDIIISLGLLVAIWVSRRLVPEKAAPGRPTYSVVPPMWRDRLTDGIGCGAAFLLAAGTLALFRTHPTSFVQGTLLAVNVPAGVLVAGRAAVRFF
ncbi:MAG: hypothetical protein E6G56_13285 [Actinobacteria bacterium]|nr:MAG: hypothetical protein E6G56_13285 [Actinomycetota bacterium]